MTGSIGEKRVACNVVSSCPGLGILSERVARSLRPGRTEVPAPTYPSVHARLGRGASLRAQDR